MRIAVDAMGGDFAPREVVTGAVQAARELETEVLLVGDTAAITQVLQECCGGAEQPFVSLVPASEVVEMNESAAQAVRRKRDSSVAVAARLIRAGEANALVSAGNTGAAVASAVLYMGQIPGIERPAIACVLPTFRGRMVCLDLGAVVDCRPRQFVDFAIMGSIYAHRVLGVEKPRVVLLNIGAEESKGNETTKAAYRLLHETVGIDFAGNCEPDELFSGEFEVAVCDGFVGNILLKTAEGVGSLVTGLIRREIENSQDPECMRKVLGPVVQRALFGLAYEEHGGAHLLGVNGVCVIGHGRSSAKAIVNAIRVARRGAEQDVVGYIAKLVSKNAG